MTQIAEDRLQVCHRGLNQMKKKTVIVKSVSAFSYNPMMKCPRPQPLDLQLLYLISSHHKWILVFL